jgi:GH24 family phage-related lysozyme (muramidase)
MKGLIMPSRLVRIHTDITITLTRDECERLILLTYNDKVLHKKLERCFASHEWNAPRETQGLKDLAVNGGHSLI